MENIPGVFTPSAEAKAETEIEERWTDSPVGRVRYFVDKDGNMVNDRRSDSVTNFRLAKLEVGHGQISRQLELNTAITQKNAQDTARIIEILDGTRTLVKIVSFLAPISKWAVTVGAAVLFFYALLKGRPAIPNITIFDGE